MSRQYKVLIWMIIGVLAIVLFQGGALQMQNDVLQDLLRYTEENQTAISTNRMCCDRLIDRVEMIEDVLR